MIAVLLTWAFFASLCGLLVGGMASSKGYGFLGWFLFGFLLPLPAFVVVAIREPKYVKETKRLVTLLNAREKIRARKSRKQKQ